MKRTETMAQIMATVSDYRCTPQFLNDLFRRGVDCVRVNSAHVSPQRLAEMVGVMRQVRPGIAILTDTKGPEVRTGDLAGGLERLAVSAGERFVVRGGAASASTFTDRGVIAVNYDGSLAGRLAEGQRVLIDDGNTVMRLIGFTPLDEPIVEATADCELLPRKGISFPGVDLADLPAVTETDAENLRCAARLGLAMVAHSFVRSEADVEAVRAILDDAGGHDVKIFSKIECRSGLENFSSILAASDGILIARGDLGTEVSPAIIPALQRELIRRASGAGKPVIVATQFLQSMMNSPKPTRAEMTDIATAVWQGADTLLLCGETAAGNFPLEAVEAMKGAIEGTRADACAYIR